MVDLVQSFTVDIIRNYSRTFNSQPIIIKFSLKCLFCENPTLQIYLLVYEPSTFDIGGREVCTGIYFWYCCSKYRQSENPFCSAVLSRIQNLGG